MIDVLPTEVIINDKKHAIRNKCDYRVVLDVISALNDEELNDVEKIQCALFVFYEKVEDIDDYEVAKQEMFKIINNGDEFVENEPESPKIMDWEHDFKILVAPINRVLGCEIRTIEYLHWWTLLAGYLEIGECLYNSVISIRKKRMKGQPLSKEEQEFYRENRKMIELPQNLTQEEKDWLDSDW